MAEKTDTQTKDLQNKFCEFYSAAVKDLFDFESKDFQKEVNSVRRAVHADRLKEEGETSRPWLEFVKEPVRCAYLLRYSVLNSISVVKHFQKMRESNLENFDQLLATDTIRICCFGGGPGTELVAIVKTLNDFLNGKCGEEKSSPLKVYFTILDVCNSWKKWAESLVRKMRSCNILCDNDRVDVHMRFIQVNLTDVWGENVLKAVQKANILTMVKFFSALNLSEEDFELKKDLRLMSEVCENIKLDAWIFFLDFAGGGYYHTLDKHMRRYQCYEKYHSYLHQTHSVEIKMWCKELLSKNSFVDRMMMGASITTVSSCSWKKCVPQLKIRKKKTSNQPTEQKTKSRTPKEAVKLSNSLPATEVLNDHMNQFLDEKL